MFYQSFVYSSKMTIWLAVYWLRLSFLDQLYLSVGWINLDWACLTISNRLVAHEHDWAYKSCCSKVTNWGALFVIRSFIRSLARSFVHYFINLFVRTFILSFKKKKRHSLFLRTRVALIHSLVHSFIRPFTHAFLRSFNSCPLLVHLFPSSHSFIHAFIFHSFSIH